MARRIVVHAGFHKTGAAEGQAILQENGPLLWPVMALGLRDKLQPVLSAARGFSTWKDPASLTKFRERLGAFLGELGLGQRGLLIAAEELSGHLPGRGEILDYSAAPVLLAEMEAVLKRAYPAADLSFVLSLRQHEAWLRCVHWEHVKSTRMTLEYDAFAARLAGLDLSQEAEAVRNALQSPVELIWVEDCADSPFGTVTPLLERMALEEDLFAALVQTPPRHMPPEGQEALLAQFLALNRSRIAPAALRAAKAAALERA